VRPDRFRDILSICVQAKEIDAVLVIMAPQVLADPKSVAQALATAVKGHRYPVFACWMGGKSMAPAVGILNAAGIPTYETPERAIQAFLYMYTYSRNLETLSEIPPRLTARLDFDRQRAADLISVAPQKGFMSESDSKEILAVYGLPVIKTEMAATEEQAADLAAPMTFLLAMKLHSPDITQKTDAGGIVLDLRSTQDVRQAFIKIIQSAKNYKPGARINSVTLQPFVNKPDYEILLGAKRDPNFGPVILFGMGGIFTEVLKDRALALPPMNRLLAHRLIQETKAYKLLKGYRNRSPADLQQLEEMIIRLSQLIIDQPDIAELDMNPVLIKDGQALAVDARILVYSSGVASPKHLVISPYPESMSPTRRSRKI